MKPDPTFDPTVLRGVCVLVVEDAWHVAKAMKGMLEQLGMDVLGPAATAAEARRLLTPQKPPRAALVDVNLRGEMAWDLIDDLRQQGVEVIVMSGYALPDASRGRPMTYLQKPFDATELLAALCAVVDKCG
jgi:DNA-binding response OmpR family regulator